MNYFYSQFSKLHIIGSVMQKLKCALVEEENALLFHKIL